MARNKYQFPDRKTAEDAFTEKKRKAWRMELAIGAMLRGQTVEKTFKKEGIRLKIVCANFKRSDAEFTGCVVCYWSDGGSLNNVESWSLPGFCEHYKLISRYSRHGHADDALLIQAFQFVRDQFREIAEYDLPDSFFGIQE